MLADMGAEVIKVEPPPWGDDTRLWGPPFVGGISTYFHSINRNKKSLGLNLKSEEGRKILWKLIARADVLVENFRPDVLQRLGFGYEAVSEHNPRILYCSISGFGQTGPYRARPGYDVVIQGESGIMDLTGHPDGGPAKVGTAIADIVAGMYAVQGILLALLTRHRTNKGQRIDVSLLDSAVSTLTYQALTYLMTGDSPQRMGTRHPSITPYECYRTSDGFVNIAVTNPKQWVRFCNVLGFPELAADERFATLGQRLVHYDELKDRIAPVIAAHTRSEILAKMASGEIPAGPINTVAEIMEDPQIHARDMIRELTHPEYGPIRLLGIPVKLSDTPGAVESPPPYFGEHNKEILNSLGYSTDDVESLVRAGVLDGR
jgi:crotonobetainyl-CoA:carnitine CoA-transferase CaiB-like acyl-CoA transferase